MRFRLILVFFCFGWLWSEITARPSSAQDSSSYKENSFSRHSMAVASVAFSPDGKRIASAGGDRVKVTDLSTGKEILKLKNSPDMKFNSVAYSPNGRFLAGAQSYLKNRKSWRQKDQTITTFIYYGEVLIWDAQTGALQSTLNYDNSPAWQIAFSPDNRWLAIATGPVPEEENKDCEKEQCDGWGEVFLIATQNWKIVSHLRGNRLPMLTLAFSPDSRRLAASSRGLESWGDSEEKQSFEIFVWDTETGKPIQTLPGHSRAVTALAFSPDGKLLASAGRDQSLKVWDLQNSRILQSASDLVVSYEELEAASAKAEGKKNAMPPISWLSGIVFTPDGRQIIGCGGDGIIRRYKTESGKMLEFIKPRDWPIMTWTRTWDPSGLAFHNLSRHSSNLARLTSIALSPDGNFLVTGGIDGKIRVLSFEKN